MSITFARGGAAKTSKPAKQGIAKTLVDAIVGDGGCGNGTVNGKKGFQKGNKCSGKENRNAEVAAARSAHTAASRAAKKHLSTARKTRTPLSKEGRASIKAAAAAHRKLQEARATHQAARKDARNAKRREARAAAKAASPKPPKAQGPDPKAEAKARLKEANVQALKDRIDASAKQAGGMKAQGAADRLRALKADSASGKADGDALRKGVDRIGRGTTKDELFAAAKAAGIEHNAKTKGALVEHLKGHIAGQGKPKAAEKAPEKAKAPEAKPKAAKPKTEPGTAADVTRRINELREKVASGRIKPENVEKHANDIVRSAMKGKLEDGLKAAGIEGMTAHRSYAAITRKIADHARASGKAGPATPSTPAELRKAIRGAGDRAQSLARDHVDRAAGAATTRAAEHGMTHPEDFRSFEHEGVRYHFPNSEAGRDLAARSLVLLSMDRPIPASLASHTREVYFTSQGNRHDPYFGALHGRSDFKAAATGGKGTVVVYNGAPVSTRTLVHEMGHNLAAAKYGRNAPPAGSDFARAAASGEPPPSRYGASSIAEDFAESAKYYHADPEGFRASHPQRHEVMRRLFEDPNYGG